MTDTEREYIDRMIAEPPAAATCGCGTHCETVDAWCKGCRKRGAFHVAHGETHPIVYWTCEADLHTYEQPLMSDAEIIAESRRGY